MIFATDHLAGEKIMSYIYVKAAEKQPLMRAEAAARLEAEREERSGRLSLFPPLPKAVMPVPRYKHEQPRQPFQLPPGK